MLTTLWFYGSGAVDWRLLVSLTAVISGGLAACSSWKNSPVGQLTWDGQCWRWEGTGYLAGVTEQKLTVVADFQHLLLLRLENPAHVHLWLWAEHHMLPERWLDLRRAVYSPHRAVKRILRDGLQTREPMHAVAVSGHDVPADSLLKP